MRHRVGCCWCKVAQQLGLLRGIKLLCHFAPNVAQKFQKMSKSNLSSRRQAAESGLFESSHQMALLARVCANLVELVSPTTCCKFWLHANSMRADLDDSLKKVLAAR